MLFNSLSFLILFLPAALISFWCVRYYSLRFACLVLLLASIFFYGWWNIGFLPILLTSIAVNFCFGWLILRRTNRNKIYLICGILINLISLGYFKYWNFIYYNISQIFGYEFQKLNIELPIGISFFTFTQIAFLVDAYRREAQEPDIIKYGLFVTYFPHLIAGPILHHKEMMPQFSDERRRSITRGIAVGLTILVIGLFKKVIIADSIAVYSTAVFSAFDQGVRLSGVEAWIGALAFTFQLYFDFSAYSDMAVGISYMFGIRLPINFFSPYKATSIIDFWRCWHMTLSRFLRDYLYIPLGGNRKGPVRRHLNLFLTMVLGGLWHGASWNFVIWGALHGVYLISNHLFRSLAGSAADSIPPFFYWLGTFLAVVVAWVFFRAETLHGATAMISAMFGSFSHWVPSQIDKDYLLGALGSIAILLGIVTLLPNVYQMTAREHPALLPKDIEKGLREQKTLLIWKPTRIQGFAFGMTAVVIILMLSRLTIESEFLYFRF